MRIAVNTRFLIPDKLEGIGYFTYETMKRITREHPEHEFIFLFDRKFSDKFIFSKNITPKILFPPARHPLLWYWWFEYAVPATLNESKADLLLSPDGYLSLKSKLKTVLMIHDLAFEHFSHHVPLLTWKYYKHFVPKFVRHAAHIATTSEFTKSDIIEKYHIAASKIDVVYNGFKDDFRRLTSDEKTSIRQQYTSGKEYFIYVGAIQPRKNINNLFLAFDEFKLITSSDVKLVIAGRKGWNMSEIFETYKKMQFKNDVIFLDYLAIEELVNVIAASISLIYVSLFEGFGVPVLEGMKSDVPVITSNVSSLPEIAGNAALLVNPFSVDSISDGMVKIFKDDKLREDLIEKGKIQRELFSWNESAGRLWNCVEKVL